VLSVSFLLREFKFSTKFSGFAAHQLFSRRSILIFKIKLDVLCGLVVRVLGYRSGGPGSIPDTTRKKISGSGTGCTQPREYN
jgi:hypothetical protein